ncbi:MAG: nucleotide exchange factor GrpE [Gammaproteobacteria bacterium]
MSSQDPKKDERSPIESGVSVSGKKWDYVNKQGDEDDQVSEIEETLANTMEDHENTDEFTNISREELVEEIHSLKKELATASDQVLRAQAEVKNIQYTSRKNVTSARETALKNFVDDLIRNVADNFEHCLDSLKQHKDEQAIKEGVELTYRSLQNTLEKFGVEQLNPQNEPFNPEFHEAMTTQVSDEVPPNTILNVLQKGYVLHGRIVRPARVIVSKKS